MSSPLKRRIKMEEIKKLKMLRDELSKKISRLDNDLIYIKHQQTDREALIEQYENDIKTKESECLELTEKISQTAKDIEYADKEIANIIDEMTDLKADMVGLNDDFADLEETIEKLT